MRILPYIFVLVAAILWGTTGTTKTYLQQDISSFAIAGVRSAIGGGLLLLIAGMLGKLKLRHWSWRWTLFTATSIALFQCLFFTAISYSGVAIGTVVTIGSAPVFAGALEWLFFKVKPTRVWIISTILAIVGCCLLFVNQGEANVEPLGILVALAAGAMFATYTNVSKELMKREDTLPAVAMTFTVCAVLLAPLASMDGISWLALPQNILPMLFMGVVATSIAYILFLNGLQKINASSAVTLSLGEPLTAALLGVFWLGEYLSFTSWLGVFILLSGIVVLTVGSKETT